MVQPSRGSDDSTDGVEILPPERKARHDSVDWRSAGWSASGAQEIPRVYVARIGPLGLIAMIVLFGAVVATVFAVVLGFLLTIVIPAIAILVVALIVVRLLRDKFGWRLR